MFKFFQLIINPDSYRIGFGEPLKKEFVEIND